MNKVDSVQLLFQLSDKVILTQSELYDLLGIHPETYKLDSSWDEINDTDKALLLMQLYDKSIIDEETLTKEIVPLLKNVN